VDISPSEILDNDSLRPSLQEDYLKLDIHKLNPGGKAFNHLKARIQWRWQHARWQQNTDYSNADIGDEGHARSNSLPYIRDVSGK